MHCQIKIAVVADTSSSKRSENTESSDSFRLQQKNKTKKVAQTIKKMVLIFCTILWVVCCYILLTTNSQEKNLEPMVVSRKNHIGYVLGEIRNNDVKIVIKGPFLPENYGALSKNHLNISLSLVETYQCPKREKFLKTSNIKNFEIITDTWTVPIPDEKLIGKLPTIVLEKHLIINKNIKNTSEYITALNITTLTDENVPISLWYFQEPYDSKIGIIMAAIILIFLYLLLIFELVHRTVAAMFSCVLSLAVLAFLDKKPEVVEIVSWVDLDTLVLLFSMMVIVTVIGETGVFDFMAVQTYRITGGKIWPLVNTLCIITTIFTCFLDNVTTALLITPITIRLSEVMKINPVHVLTCIIVFSNVGGSLTPIGEPTNVIISSNSDVIKSGVNFMSFCLHMSLGSIICMIVVYFYLKWHFGDIKNFRYSEPFEVQDLRSKIAIWNRTAASVSSYSKDETMVKEKMKKRTIKLLGKLKHAVNNFTTTQEEYCLNLAELQRQYPIKDKVLLIKSGGILFLVIAALCLQSIPKYNTLGMGWTAFLGALLVILLYDKEHASGIFHRVEWLALIYFAALFILMEALSRLGLIETIGKQTQLIIMSVDESYRLTVAIVLILWVSGIASAFVDNLPLAAMMIKIVNNLSEDKDLNLPMQPLIWALSYGAALGANGSLFGSSANIICAGVAEQHGYKMSFMNFFKIGVPILILTMLVTTAYLIVCHVVFQWNY